MCRRAGRSWFRSGRTFPTTSRVDTQPQQRVEDRIDLTVEDRVFRRYPRAPCSTPISKSGCLSSAVLTPVPTLEPAAATDDACPTGWLDRDTRAGQPRSSLGLDREGAVRAVVDLVDDGMARSSRP